MEEVLHRLNAFLLPKTSSEPSCVSLAREGLTPEQGLDLALGEFGALSILLSKIRAVYDNFCTCSHLSLEDAPVLLPILDDASLLSPTEDRHQSQEKSTKKNTKAAPERKRILRTQFIPSEKRVENVNKSILQVDWQRVKACAENLGGVMEVIPIYSKAFENLSRRVGSADARLGETMMQLWKGHLELLHAVVLGMHAESKRNKRCTKLKEDIQRLTSRLEASKTRLERTQEEVERITRTKTDIAARVEAQMNRLADLVTEERKLLEEQVAVERRFLYARDALDKEEKYIADAMGAVSEEEDEDDGEQECNHEHQQEQSNQETQEDDSVQDKKNGSVREDGKQDSLEEDENENENEGGLSDSQESEGDTEQNPDFFLTDVFARNQDTTEDEKPSTNDESQGYLGNTREEDDFGVAVDEQKQLSEGERELLELNREIRKVERAAARRKELLRREKEEEKIRQMIKVSDLNILQQVYQELVELTQRVERKAVACHALSQHASVENRLNWNTKDNQPVKNKTSGKKKKKRDGSDAFHSLGLPCEFTQHFRPASQDLFYQREDWSLKNILRVIHQLYEDYVVLECAKVDTEEEDISFPSFVFGQFLRYYSDIDLCEQNMANFLLGVKRFSGGNLCVHIFRQLCEQDGTFVQQFFHYYALLDSKAESSDGLWYVSLETARKVAIRACVSKRASLETAAVVEDEDNDEEEGGQQKKELPTVEDVVEDLHSLTAHMEPLGKEMVSIDDLMMLLLSHSMICGI